MSSPENQTLLLRGARLVLPDRVTGASNLLVEDGRIQLIFEGGQAITRRPVRTFDLDGLTLFPGLIDIHIHGAVGVDTMEADADSLHKVARFLARHGVTSWLPTLVPAPAEDYRRVADAVTELMREQDEREAAARALGLHYEGPFVNGAQCGALRPEYFRTFKDAAELDALTVVESASATHMITVAPEIDGGIELVKELKGRGWVVSIGHTRASLEVLDRAFDAGARHMTHFMNAMAPLHHRAPGPVGWGLLRDDVTCDLIADGVHLDPLALQLVVRSKTSDRISLISDSVAPAGLGDGEYRVWGEKITVCEGRTSNERGSIAGSVITMLDALRLMLSLGVNATAVARMAATNPARLIGAIHECGTIEEGKRADLTCLDAEGRVRLTLVGGRVAFDDIS
ncbi:MAG TPA: N-acetylglucosamine-6-phosphate deacetylase [Pyrinomonadaceae bacterium]